MGIFHLNPSCIFPVCPVYTNTERYDNPANEMNKGMINPLTFQAHFVILCSVIVLRKLAKPVTGGEPYWSLLLFLFHFFQ